MIQLYGVKCLGKINEDEFEYEAVLFDNYKTEEGALLLTSNGNQYTFQELIISYLSDTCIRFILYGYYDPEVTIFNLTSL